MTISGVSRSDGMVGTLEGGTGLWLWSRRGCFGTLCEKATLSKVLPYAPPSPSPLPPFLGVEGGMGVGLLLRRMRRGMCGEMNGVFMCR